MNTEQRNYVTLSFIAKPDLKTSLRQLQANPTPAVIQAHGRTPSLSEVIRLAIIVGMERLKGETANCG